MRHHHQAVTDFKQFVQLLADHEHGAAGIAQLQQFAPDLGGRAHVHAPGGLRDQQHLGLGFDLAAHDELLQVAARQAAGGCLRAGGFDLEALDQLGRHADHAFHAQPAARADGIGACQQGVLGQRHGGHGAAAQAFFWHAVQTQAATVAWRHPADVLAKQEDAARLGPQVFSAERRHQGLLSVARHAGNAQDFTGTQLESQVFQVDTKGVVARHAELAH